MICRTYDLGTQGSYKYVVILSWFEGKIMLSRHKNRTTWETQGGHIEPGETPADAARRELYEESGASEFVLTPLCDYWVLDDRDGTSASGQVFTAEIFRLDQIPESEMAEVRFFDMLPETLTYPDITPRLFARHCGKTGGK